MLRKCNASWFMHFIHSFFFVVKEKKYYFDAQDNNLFELMFRLTLLLCLTVNDRSYVIITARLFRLFGVLWDFSHESKISLWIGHGSLSTKQAKCGWNR